jgi:plasmid replication initiation protein
VSLLNLPFYAGSQALYSIVESYKRFKIALNRLRGTTIETNIKTNGEEVIEGFGIIDSYKIVVDDRKKKRMVELEVTLSEWLYNSVIGQEVLSINNDYFRLRKPIERRIYEIARKHCGKQKQWNIGLENLHKKVGKIVSAQRLPLSWTIAIMHVLQESKKKSLKWLLIVAVFERLQL